MSHKTQISQLPQRIARLPELANNFLWVWHHEVRDLFRALDYERWVQSGRNPLTQLRGVSEERLEAAARDPAFLSRYDSVTAAFDSYLSPRSGWFAARHPHLAEGCLAYFSMEFALHSDLPLYAGGLGILAGDTCKEASDLGLPFVGIGIMYPRGYFTQRISEEGWQEEVYQRWDQKEVPLEPVFSAQGERVLARVRLQHRAVALGAWQLRVGRSRVYLLDTDFEENGVNDRLLCASLYAADPELRIQQEILLGIGGVRVLRALGIDPFLWHGNEGHAAFMMLERIREEVEKGRSFASALEEVRNHTVFTTHTPVPAGHDIFSVELVEKYFGSYWKSLGLNREAFFELGSESGICNGKFNMTILGLKTVNRRNGVSEIHQRVTQKMWRGLWPHLSETEAPITHVTNGVHLPTWIGPEMVGLYEKYLGKDWLERHDDPGLWELVEEIPDDELWAVRQRLKRKLFGAILEQSGAGPNNGDGEARRAATTGALLDPEALTIGFVRRFTEYKRQSLMFRDLKRLKRIVGSQQRPVQILFAGKSHPADLVSKRILQQVYRMAEDPDFMGRIVFIENHDMRMARFLVQGVDVWLNNPRRLQEACGTSGMKGSLNGVLHMSVPDGWWPEAYNGRNGWLINDSRKPLSSEEEDKQDAKAIYHLLEEEVAPLYYQRAGDGIPSGWIRMVKEAIRSISPLFCARRMVKDYVERMYVPALFEKEGQKLQEEL